MNHNMKKEVWHCCWHAAVFYSGTGGGKSG